MKNFSVLFLLSNFLLANPFYLEDQVEKDPLFFHRLRDLPKDSSKLNTPGMKVIRVDLKWQESTDTFVLSQASTETSGTQALYARSQTVNTLGSYKATLINKTNGKVIGYDSLGTGRMFRTLSRGLSFRFPYSSDPLQLKLIGEEPTTGEMVEMLNIDIGQDEITKLKSNGDVKFQVLKQASASPKILLNFYAEGYIEGRQNQFWSDALKAIEGLELKKVPMLDHIEFRAVFAASNETMGKAQNLGMPIEEKDTFLGLYFPYWAKFSRWHHVLYPTRMKKYRDGLAQAAYDYPVVLVDDRNYWGVGNFNELTAVPAGNSSFVYLLVHEMGHYFGLNEEYEGGGRTELEFAYEIKEPWSQNMSVLRGHIPLKWLDLVGGSTPIPTPKYYWKLSSSPRYGAYRGGYGDSQIKNGHNHKPGYSCIMSTGKYLCPVCYRAFIEKMKFDTGL